MTKACKLCNSPNRSEYEDLRLNKKVTYSDMAQIARNKYGENISTSCFSRHFNKHVEIYINARIRSDQLKEKFVKEKLKEHINASINIINTLNMLNLQLDKIKGDMDDPKARKEAREIAKTLDTVLQTALRYKDEIKPPNEETNEDVYDRLLWTLDQAKIPVDYIVKIKDMWEKYDKRSN